MGLVIAFNELSVFWTLPGADVSSQLQQVLLDPRIYRVRQSRLLIPRGFRSTLLSPKLTVGGWLTSLTVSPEARLRLKALFDKSELFESWIDDLIEYRLDDNLAQGLGLAERLDGLAFSLHCSTSQPSKNASRLTLEKVWLENETLSSATVIVRHVSSASHWDEHDGWLSDLSTRFPKNGVELWDELADRYFRLDFCPCVEGQLRQFIDCGIPLREIMRALSDLDKYCAAWTDGVFEIRRVGTASGESVTTMNKFGVLRDFTCPDGLVRRFENHVKRGNTRVHFREDVVQKRILVGYVGKHLQI